MKQEYENPNPAVFFKPYIKGICKNTEFHSSHYLLWVNSYFSLKMSFKLVFSRYIIVTFR